MCPIFAAVALQGSRNLVWLYLGDEAIERALQPFEGKIAELLSSLRGSELN